MRIWSVVEWSGDLGLGFLARFARVSPHSFRKMGWRGVGNLRASDEVMSELIFLFEGG